MKPRVSHQKTAALTLLEVVVVVVLLLIVAAFLLPAFTKAKIHGGPNCINNIKQIGLSFQIWSGDNLGKLPMEVSVTNGGALELCATGNVAAVFRAMSNEISTPKILICQKDKSKTFATNFGSGLTAKNVSYFVGLDANTNRPRAFLSGDDNFQTHGAPVQSSVITLWTNSPLSWTSARHNFSGNIGFVDGRVDLFGNQTLRELLQKSINTNRLAIP
jgi:prepilin-type processing-associated H-X9-DG protein